MYVSIVTMWARIGGLRGDGEGMWRQKRGRALGTPPGRCYLLLDGVVGVEPEGPVSGPARPLIGRDRLLNSQRQQRLLHLVAAGLEGEEVGEKVEGGLRIQVVVRDVEPRAAVTHVDGGAGLLRC